MIKEKAKKISATLKKFGNKTGKKIFKDIGKRILKPKRTFPKVNVWKLNKIAEKQKNKLLIVPGHVLGTGELNNKISVAALSFSKSAKEKILKANGKTLLLEELAKTSEKTSSMVIVK